MKLAKKSILILDGPTGTELMARGYRPDPAVWTARAALDAPELLKAIHADYLRAGANIITANTFRTSSYAAAKGGLTAADARRFTHASAALATEAIEEVEPAGPGPRFLAGSLAPLEDCYVPRLVPELAVLERVHFETAGWLVEAGCDLVLAETMGTAREAVVAVRAARRAGAPSVAVGFIADETGARLLGGDPLVETARECVASGAEAVLVNCVHADVIERALPLLKPLLDDGVVVGAYANASRMRISPTGHVEWEHDTRPVDARAREYAERAEGWMRAHGARILGSCCGTSPEYIRELSERLGKFDRH